ncbi:binding-protein-dependent transport systems inner membrane component [Bacillus thuringiensis MC28]|nr:binding-protein-dependent transport systems inner membrane component [Bacillus thuringiensis MC28]
MELRGMFTVQGMRLIIKYIFSLIITLFSIFLIIILPRTSVNFTDKQSWKELFNAAVDILNSFIGLDQLIVPVNQVYFQSFVEILQGPYLYTIIILLGGLLISLVITTVLAYIIFLLPKRTRLIVNGLTFIMNSIPDVIMIFSIQLFIIFIFKETGVMIFNPISGFENIYAIPILTMAILPASMLYQLIIIAITNEEKKLYVEYAIAKGLSRHWIISRHIFRNVIVSLFGNLQYIFWFMFSSLLIMEYLFNEYKQILEEHHIICEPLVEQVFNDYSIKGFPFAIYIKNGKVISKGPAPSLKAINEVKRITGKVA